MNGGAKFLACTALLAIAACVGEDGKLEVRSLPTPLAQGKQPVPFRIAEAAQQFALGNTALALESYRKAWREDPNSLEALAGIAACYDRMGRFDLSRRHYEAALAIEPHNSTLLNMLAASLDQQGKTAEALAVRSEVAERLAAAQPQAAAAIAAPTTTAPAVVAAVAVPSPIQQAAAVAEVEKALPKPQLEAVLPMIAAAPLAISGTPAMPSAVVAAFAADDPAKPQAIRPAAEKPVAVAEVKVGQTVTVKLPAPRPAPVPMALSEATPVPAAAVPQPATPLPAPDKRVPQAVPVMLPAAPNRAPAPLRVAIGTGPRLERTSLGEVALITKSEPQWASLVVKQNQRSATVRFVPLREANARLASVRLLNAARVQGLAARTRSTLYDRGWRAIAIGDASVVRARSLVLYPAHRRSTALTLARQFGFAAAQRASGREITVLLGRDSALLTRRAPSA